MRNFKRFLRKIKNSKLTLKVCAFAFSAICVVSVVGFTLLAKASEKSTITLEAEKNEVVRGTDETVTFTMKIDAKEAYNSILYEMKYDTDALEFVSCTPTSGTATCAPLDASYNSDNISYALISTSDLNGESTLGTITFKVKDKASGKTQVELENIQIEKYDAEFNTTTVESEGENAEVFVKVPVKNVSLATSNLEIDLGSESKQAAIVVNYDPEDTTDSKEFTYSEYDSSKIDVSAEGIITGKAIGSTTVKVKAFNQEFTVNVQVVAHINSVSLDTDKVTLDLTKKETHTFVATINPNPTSDDTKITWDSSESDVAEIDESGLVTPKKIGTTIIKATTVNGKEATATVTVVDPVTKLDITDVDFTLAKGNTKDIAYTITPTITSDEVIWESDNQKAVTVTNEGKVTAVGGGVAKITVRAGSLSDSVTITVNVLAKDILLDVAENETISLYPNTYRQVNATIVPDDTTNKTISWSVENDTIAEVDSTGKVTAKTPGSTKLFAEIDGIKVTRNIKVLIPVQAFTVDTNKATLNLNEKQTLTLKTTIQPDNTDVSKDINWQSSNAQVAKVEGESNGEALVTPLSIGDTTITGTLEDGSEVTVEIKVIAPITGVTLNKDEVTLSGVGASETLEAQIIPDPTSDDPTLTWESNDDTTVKVENGKITALKKGNATITVTTSNGKTATCNVTVVIPTTNIEINSDDLVMEKGTTENITATITPSDSDDPITWSSSDDSIVSVDENGNLKALKVGSATITATSGTKSATINVDVIISITSFELVSDAKITILKGNTSSIITKINPDDTTENKVITWTSNKENIATVSNDGVVTGKKAGTAIITGTLENGMSVEVEVEVTIIPITSLEAKDAQIDILKGENKLLELIIEPNNTTEKDTIIWTSSDEDIATVSNTGIVTGKKAGTVIITASIEDLKATFTFNVKEIHLESMNVINPKTKLGINESFNIELELQPQNVTDDLTFTYKSSDESIATVSETGVVTGIKAGNVTITIMASNGVELTYNLTIVDNNVSATAPQTGDNIIYAFITLGISVVVVSGYYIKRKFNK